MPTSKLGSNWRITVPKEVRDHLGLRPGDELEFARKNDGYHMRKHKAESPFAHYEGYLADLAGQNPDDLIEGMRGSGL